jgi:DNA-binding LytR/AlgR family response regulator
VSNVNADVADMAIGSACSSKSNNYSMKIPTCRIGANEFSRVLQLYESTSEAKHRDDSTDSAAVLDHNSYYPPPELPVPFHLPRCSHSKLEFLVGERQRRFYPLEMGKIDYIEAQGNYVMIHSGTNAYIRRDSIKRLAGHLAVWGFMRIERSILLNARAVAYAQAADHGTFAFTLYSGACFQSSRSYRDAILDVLPLEPLSQRPERSRITRSNEK